MGTWMTYRPELAVEGARVASWPDHRGAVREGVIRSRYGLYGKEYIEVVYDGEASRCLLAENGRYSETMDTSIDVGMVWRE